MKRAVSAAAVAAGLGLSAVLLDAGPAYSAPTRPIPLAPDTPTEATTPAPKTTATKPQTTQAPQTTAPQTTAPQSTVAPTQTTTAPATQTTTAPSTQTTTPSAQTTTTPSSTQTTTTTASSTTTSSSGQTTTSGSQTTTSSGQTTTPAGQSTSTTPAPGITIVINAPPTQPPHPPFIPRIALVLPGAQIGGPADTLAGFSLPGRGAPPPPPARGFGWNDGFAPGHPPPNWQGPPPPGGWNGPPPPGGWNRPWNGPVRDVGYARNDFGQFNYNSFTVTPVFNWQYGGWGYWFFGVWVPLY
ncbi:MAP_0585 family protein [Mycobacterium asiaticum]|uniref:MAP_0585 family protein n=1 Tax=Mycobacterium asiaticum TaxID=1790 RepID=UPI00314024E7